MTEQADAASENDQLETVEGAPKEEVSHEVLATVEEEDVIPLVEALIFANGEPISLERLRSGSTLKKEVIEQAIEEITKRCEERESGMRLVKVGGKYQFRTKERWAPYLQKLKTGRPRKLSPAALETLAVVAYRQPVVKSDIEKIRGVDPTPTLKTLLDRKLIRIVGHQDTVGQPALYGSTDEFLKIFGLESLRELPTLRDLREFDEEPGEEEEEDTISLSEHTQDDEAEEVQEPTQKAAN